MPIFLPIAGLSINGLLLIGAGTMVGFLSGLLGVGGGFLLTPLLTMIGIPATVAAASDTNSIVATSSSGVAAHFRIGNVDIKMGTYLLLGGLTGAAIGVQGIKILRSLGEADLVIRICYVVMLGVVGGLMAIDALRKRRHGTMVVRSHEPAKTTGVLNRLPFRVTFPRSGVEHSLILVLGLSVVVGVLTAIMGVGGGFMLVPLMVYVLHMPAHVAVGTSLFQILFTCSGASYMQATANHTVDLVLALIVALGSTVGAQIGAAVSRKLRGEQLMILLAGLALLVAGRMAVGLVVPPSNLLDASHGVTSASLRSPAANASQDVLGAGGLPTVELTPKTVQIGAMYGGTPMRVEGLVPAGSGVIVLVTGGGAEQVFKHRGRVGPIWGTIGKVHVSGAPALFVRYSSAPVENMLTPEEIRDHRLSTDALRSALEISPQTQDGSRLREDYIRLKLGERVYRQFDNMVKVERKPGDLNRYSLQFHWPRMAPPARYRVDVYACKDGAVVAHTRSHLRVAEVGEPALLAGMATNEAPLYGIFGVIVAALAGFGIDFVTAATRKRLSRRAPAGRSESAH